MKERKDFNLCDWETKETRGENHILTILILKKMQKKQNKHINTILVFTDYVLKSNCYAQFQRQTHKKWLSVSNHRICVNL